MNLDKTIKGLMNRIDEVYPASSTTNGGISHDGIHYWKGKKIISVKDWKDLYEKSSTYTNGYTTTLISRRPLQYFPDDYNDSISISNIVKDEKLTEEIQKWNKEYYELLEYRKNPTLGRNKCAKCLLSGSNDDPIFVGIEKVFARIVSNQCNNNDTVNDYSHSPNITYHCNVMNIFTCPFESIKSYNEKEIESKYYDKREDLFTLQRISFAIEQAITTFFEITKDNEIIYQVDFENDRVQEIHTKYNGEPESWGWQKNIKEQLSKVKPITNIIIRDEQGIYSILTNREKLEYIFQEYEKKYNHQLEEQEICCDENIPCVPNNNNNSNNEKVIISELTATTINESLTTGKEYQQQLQYRVQEAQKDKDDAHKGKNRHSNKLKEESDNEKLISNLKTQIKDELEEHEKEQQILLKENKQTIIDFLMNNKDSIKIEDLKIYEPIYKCYREKGYCHVCNRSSNIICINCCNHNYNNKEVWLCTNHWQNHAIEKHEQEIR